MYLSLFSFPLTFRSLLKGQQHLNDRVCALDLARAWFLHSEGVQEQSAGSGSTHPAYRTPFTLQRFSRVLDAMIFPLNCWPWNLAAMTG